MVSPALLEFSLSPDLFHAEILIFILTFCSLAGMLEKVGLLPAFNNQQIPFAYKMYKSPKRKLYTEFKRKFGSEVRVEFIGLWCVFFEMFPLSK